MITEQEVKEKTIERFWAKIKFGKPDECWEWIASLSNKYGYFMLGIINGKKKGTYSHIYILVKLFGETKNEIHVKHKCGNSKCCNPNHLFASAWMDSTAEMHKISNAEWRDITGYEGLYKINSEGDVWSLKECIKMATYTNGEGYVTVALRRRGKPKIGYRIHNLLGRAFIPNHENKRTINHKNGIKNDNRLENLEWATQKEQVNHAMYVLKRPYGKCFRKKIYQYSISGNFIKEWESAADVTRDLKINGSSISMCISGKRNHAGGFCWKFKTDNYGG